MLLVGRDKALQKRNGRAVCFCLFRACLGKSSFYNVRKRHAPHKGAFDSAGRTSRRLPFAFALGELATVYG